MFFIQQPPRHRRFTVTGIYHTGLEEFDKLFVFCDIKHIQKLNGWEDDQVSGFEIFIDKYDALDETGLMVLNEFAYRFLEDGSRLKVRTIKQNHPQIFEWLRLTDTNVWVILTLMLIVAVFNMVSGILILILEQTAAIGLLKAMGSRNNSIRKIFLIHGAHLTLRGLIWGNLIGLGIAFAQLYFQIITLDPESYYVSVVPINIVPTHIILLNAGTIALTLFALVIPSSLISRISPSKAIQFN